jgi:hypothetical protein
MLNKPNFDDSRDEALALDDADEPASDASHLLRPSFYWQGVDRAALAGCDEMTHHQAAK